MSIKTNCSGDGCGRRQTQPLLSSLNILPFPKIWDTKKNQENYFALQMLKLKGKTEKEKVT